MRAMVLVKATKDSEAGKMPSTEILEAMGQYNQDLADAGILQAGEGLKPSSQGKRVAFDGINRTIVDGPFSATGELVAGFWLWEVEDMDEAVAWVKRCPNPMSGPSEIEIRPVFEIHDFGDALTPELTEQEEKLRQSEIGSQLRLDSLTRGVPSYSSATHPALPSHPQVQAEAQCRTTHISSCIIGAAKKDSVSTLPNRAGLYISESMLVTPSTTCSAMSSPDTGL